MDGESTAIATPMCTFSGKRFYPLEPNLDDISIVDIAHGLSNVCRYGGQCKEFYSVAQHSLLVSREVPLEDAREGLLHDATEAYIGDVINPLKTTVPFEFYRQVEERLEEAIAEKFELKYPWPASVKEYDLIIRHTEMRDFGSVPKEIWENEPVMDYRIKPLPPQQAKILFLKEFSRLFGYDTEAWRYFQ
jgi:5'-nucleotidase